MTGWTRICFQWSANASYHYFGIAPSRPTGTSDISGSVMCNSGFNVGGGSGKATMVFDNLSKTGNWYLFSKGYNSTTTYLYRIWLEKDV